jgi:hypothetical protein
MTTASLTRAQVQQHLDATQATLAANIADRSAVDLAAIPVTPEWSALDILRHIEVWGELAARCLNDWHGPRDWILTFASEDQFNQEMVAMRANWDLPTILAGIHEAYAGYTNALNTCSDAELAEHDAAPWGQSVSRLALIHFSLNHDDEHIAALSAAISPNPDAVR